MAEFARLMEQLPTERGPATTARREAIWAQVNAVRSGRGQAPLAAMDQGLRYIQELEHALPAGSKPLVMHAFQAATDVASEFTHFATEERVENGEMFRLTTCSAPAAAVAQCCDARHLVDDHRKPRQKYARESIDGLCKQGTNSEGQLGTAGCWCPLSPKMHAMRTGPALRNRVRVFDRGGPHHVSRPDERWQPRSLLTSLDVAGAAA